MGEGTTTVTIQAILDQMTVVLQAFYGLFNSLVNTIVDNPILAIVVIFVVALGILLGTSMNALASSEKDIASYNKYYVSICIESGDTLWSIADEYIDGFKDIKK